MGIETYLGKIESIDEVEVKVGQFIKIPSCQFCGETNSDFLVKTGENLIWDGGWVCDFCLEKE